MTRWPDRSRPQMYFVAGRDGPIRPCTGGWPSGSRRLAQKACSIYLAIPPSVYATVVEGLETAGLAGTPDGGWRRLIVEKPFGTDLASARSLNALLHRHFAEEQIFRIDHYLGKETVQNLLVLRFANGMFEPIWNRRYIDQVQITAAETVGVERRASYYEGAGALRDMVQNHLMQLLSLVAMEPPTEFSAASVRDRKMDALLAVQPILGGDGRTAGRPRAIPRRLGGRQRSAGLPRGAGRRRRTRGPKPSSRLRLKLDSWRWAGVPFYLRTGKAAAEANHGNRHPVPPSAAADLPPRQPDAADLRPARHQRAA